MKNGVNSRPWASGCRAIPEISALPAMPSTIPAPMAPPAMMRPPPMRAPIAIWGSISYSSLLAGSSLPGLCCGVGLVVCVVFHLHRLREVQDGQQREDERLEQPDEQVECLPNRV